MVYDDKIQNQDILSGYRFCNKVTPEDKEEWREKEYRNKKLADRFPGEIHTSVPNKKQRICLTFDDAPDKKNTPKILDILKEHKVKATFFVLGKRVPRYSGLVRRMESEGHYIGGHTQSHPDLTSLSNEEIKSEVMVSSRKIKNVIGRVPDIFRPPFGLLDDRVIQVLKEMGLDIVLWSVNTCDWLERKPENIIHNIISHTNSGDIILLHSYMGKEPTVRALPEIITGLMARNYEFVTIDQLLSVPGYH